MGRKTKIEAVCDECAKLIQQGGTRKTGCLPCRNARRNALCAKARAEKGLLPWGTATAVYREKQRQDQKRKAAEARAAKGLPPYGSGLRSPYCTICGDEKECPTSGYCNTCKSDRAAELRAERKRLNPNFATEEKAKREQRKLKDRMYTFKVQAHRYVAKAIRLGVLKEQPCEICGNFDVDAHHDDYTKPLEVRWLCRSCHRKHHEQRLNEET